MERDFARQVARVCGDARAVNLMQRAFRRDRTAEGDDTSAADASYVAGRRRALKAMVAETSAFHQVVDPVMRDLLARRR